MAIDWTKFEAASKSVESWFPLIHKFWMQLEEAYKFGSSFLQHTTCDQLAWEKATQTLLQLAAEVQKHSAGIYDAFIEFEFGRFDTPKIIPNQDPFFGDDSKRSWLDAHSAVHEETLRILRSIIDQFDPLYDLATDDALNDLTKAIDPADINETQVEKAKQLTRRFAMLWDMPDRNGDFRRWLRDERVWILNKDDAWDLSSLEENAPGQIDDNPPDFSKCPWKDVYEFLWLAGIRVERSDDVFVLTIKDFRSKYKSRRKDQSFRMPEISDAKSIRQGYTRKLMASGLSENVNSEFVGH